MAVLISLENMSIGVFIVLLTAVTKKQARCNSQEEGLILHSQVSVHPGRADTATGGCLLTSRRMVAERERSMPLLNRLLSLCLFTQYRTPVPGMMPSTSRVGLSFSVKPF